ncbi:MAG: TetR/AcrR family transcriptional regulator [Myxococcales bacterium]|nr:TetR/AcrR family transcriptional regulator [Myxococcota bacterium]MDW8282784.1 TetR/AcrR family transcriptional regulator [Myxococcales bacterium]
MARRDARVRRTQQERSAATRERLLEAAFRCLVDKGFTGTSTALVCRKARLSRGALLHHFPNKQQLLTAAADYVFSRRLAEFRAAYCGVPPQERGPEAAIDLLWGMISGPTYYAWLELVVASRTDPALRLQLRGVMERFAAEVQQVYEEFFPPPHGPGGTWRTAPQFAFAVLKGLAIDRIISDDSEHTGRVLRLLKRLAAPLGALGPAPGSEGPG